MRVWMLVFVLGAVSARAQVEGNPTPAAPHQLPPAKTVQMIKETAPPPSSTLSMNVILQGAAGNVNVPFYALPRLAESEPAISAPEGGPQEGMVLLTLKVSKTGAVVDVGFIEQGDEGLRRAAIDGVQQWRYKPLLVNGEPQEFQSTVTVEFLNGVGKRASAGGMSGMAGRVMGGIGTPPPVEARAPGVPNGPVRVSSGVIASLMLKRVDPVYPPIARAAGVQGVVILHAILSKNGTIESLQVISGSPMLMGAAMDAVKLWRYKPYLLNGVPVEVDTVINVNFMLETAPPPGDGGAPENPK